MIDELEGEGWKVVRWANSENIYIYEFWHKPLEPDLPVGRYLKYTQQGEEIIVIEDGPYLGQTHGRK